MTTDGKSILHHDGQPATCCFLNEVANGSTIAEFVGGISGNNSCVICNR